MPEPDFEKIAGIIRMCLVIGPLDEALAAIEDELSQVWNARGAADLDAMETAHLDYNWTELEDGIRRLDR